jgi:hypothetical protein
LVFGFGKSEIGGDRKGKINFGSHCLQQQFVFPKSKAIVRENVELALAESVFYIHFFVEVYEPDSTKKWIFRSIQFD